jgi:hypothetical protein
MIVRGIFADAPSEIHGLEAAVVARAQVVQARKNISLQGVTFVAQVAERRADEDPERSL